MKSKYSMLFLAAMTVLIGVGLSACDSARDRDSSGTSDTMQNSNRSYGGYGGGMGGGMGGGSGGGGGY